MADEGRKLYRLPPYRLGAKVYFASDIQQVIDWGQNAVGVPAAQKLSRGRMVRVGIADTGLPDHPDVVKQIVASQNFSSSSDVIDRQGHSSHVTGTLCANGKLLGCAPECQVLIAKVLGDDGSGSNDQVAAGINWLTSEGVDIVSGSLGGPYDEQIAEAVYAAMNKGILCIFAAGNEGETAPPTSDTVGYPAALPPCAKGERPVAVAAYNRNGQLSSFSSRGTEVTIAFPGEDILSCWLGGTYRRLSGTSMATPLSAGVTALLKSYEKTQAAGGSPVENPITDNASLIERLKATATEKGPPGFDPGWGWGIIDAFKLIGTAKAGTKTAPPASTAGIVDLVDGVHSQRAQMAGKVGAFIWKD